MSLDRLLATEGIKRFPGAEAGLFERLRIHNGISLPVSHEMLLAVSNGAEAYHGYFRLFGISNATSLNLALWNSADHWKFAWGGRCDNYWCFGETAWGDQYAYHIAELVGGKTPKIYFLDALSMTPEQIGSDFDDFLENEFQRCASDPYDIMIKAAREKIGDLEPESHLVYVPSLLLGGEEDISNVQKMNARAAMISNGDIAIQLDEGPADRGVSGVEAYQDDKDRTRLQLVWS